MDSDARREQDWLVILRLTSLRLLSFAGFKRGERRLNGWVSGVGGAPQREIARYIFGWEQR